MRITKYEHSCLDIHDHEARLVIDPGRFSPSFTDCANIAVLILTHVHRDHFDKETVGKIVAANPGVMIFAPKQVADEILDASVTVPEIGKIYEAAGFSLEFFGGEHELYDGFQNIAVLVDGTLYHPGDSYTLPHKPIKILAAPAAAPWLRVTEAGEFIKSAKAQRVFPIHNALLSPVGEEVHYRILGEAAQTAGSDWHVLQTGESIEI